MIHYLSEMIEAPVALFVSLCIGGYWHKQILLARVVNYDLPANHGNPKLPSASASSVFAERCFLTSSLVAYADEQCF